ncbi:ribosomal maturation YjgA family protein [Paenibacillus sp. WC2504]|uniref:ribosomal maturation YjgA family protein n=1 Tax=Paenibacillus sp. WC2504 TaxID=3461403 RepID=UPI0040458A49
MLKYAAAIVVTIVLGLSSRRFPNVFPDIIAVNAGDILWASMIYFGFRFICTKRSLAWAVGWSVIFCFGIEFSQLYQAEWIVAVRRTVVGSLILGRGFLTIDLARYVIGIAAAWLFDKYVFQRSNR